MEYLKFTRQFVNDLNFENIATEQSQPTDTMFDSFLQGKTKSFLVNNRSFATTQEQLNEIKFELEESYKDLVEILLPQFDETIRLISNKEITKTRTLTQNYGNEKVETSSFEPVVNDTQAETKQSAQNTSWQPDETTETETDFETSHFDAMREFFYMAKDVIIETFEKYINTLLLGVD